MDDNERLKDSLSTLEKLVFNKLNITLSNIQIETEGVEYDACQFMLNGKKVLFRSAKITPKKVGQFVTCWKRNSKRVTEPYSAFDGIDLYVISVKFGDRLGQFVFPRAELINKGIMSSDKGAGKRGFRVYPKWDEATNRQAKATQTWQLNYFYEIQPGLDFNRVNELYKSI